MKKLLLVLLGIALAVPAAGALWWRHALQPVGESETDVVFTIAPGTSLRRLGRDLETAGLVRNAHAFEWLGRSREAASQLRAGEYLLRNHWGADEILDQIVAGHVRTYEVSLPECLTAAEMAVRIEAAGLAEAEAFLSVVHDPAAPARFGVGAIDNLQCLQNVPALARETIDDVHKPAATVGHTMGHNRF